MSRYIVTARVDTYGEESVSKPRTERLSKVFEEDATLAQVHVWLRALAVDHVTEVRLAVDDGRWL